MWRPKSLVSRWPPTKHRNNITKPPTTEGIGNSRGVGGSKTQEIPEGRGVGQSNHFPGGQYHFVFDLSSNIASYRPGRSFLGRKQLEIYHLRLFLLMLTKFPFFQEHSGCNFKGISPTTTRFITYSYIRPPLLVTSLPQDINTCNTSRCVSRSIEEQ